MTFALPGAAQHHVTDKGLVPWNLTQKVGIRTWSTFSATNGSITTGVFDYPQGTLQQALDSVAAPLKQVPKSKLITTHGMYHGRPYIQAVATYREKTLQRAEVRFFWVADGHMVRVMLSDTVANAAADTKTFNEAVNSIGFPAVHVSLPPQVVPTTFPKPPAPTGK